jgi:hypothetical protein
MTLRSATVRQAALGVLCATALTASALGQDGEHTRGVRILDDAPAAPATPAPSQPVTAPPVPVIELGKEQLKTENPAGVSIEILPRADLQVGAHVSFKVKSRTRGYLLLVDVDADGKLSQIYPNPGSLMLHGRESSNLIRPGRTITIPDKDDPLAGFEFVASPPQGIAMVVAILSDRPVQVIDLPDVPQKFAGQTAALEYVTALAHSLRIPDSSGTLEEAKWSFDAKFYRIQ